MVLVYINSHLISPASLKYITTGTSRKTESQISETWRDSGLQTLSSEAEKRTSLACLNTWIFGRLKCDSLPKIINVSRNWLPSGSGRVRPQWSVTLFSASLSYSQRQSLVPWIDSWFGCQKCGIESLTNCVNSRSHLTSCVPGLLSAQ